MIATEHYIHVLIKLSENVPSLLETQGFIYVLCRMTLEYYIKVIMWNVRSTTQSNCLGIFSQCYLFNVRKGTSCELSLKISCHLCVLVCFGLGTVLIIYNYLNNIDMVLLRTSYMYGGFFKYYFRLQFSAFWSMHDKTSS